jgi:hypothetical protein
VYTPCSRRIPGLDDARWMGESPGTCRYGLSQGQGHWDRTAAPRIAARHRRIASPYRIDQQPALFWKTECATEPEGVGRVRLGRALGSAVSRVSASALAGRSLFPPAGPS